MNPKPLSESRDEDVRNITAAFKRAALRARIVAAQTNTCIVVVRNGKIVKETPVLPEKN